MFLTDVDLELHLIVFGRNAVLHGRNFRRIHFDVEMTLSREHGGADRIVRSFENIIFDYVKDCKKFNRKVYVLE